MKWVSFLQFFPSPSQVLCVRQVAASHIHTQKRVNESSKELRPHGKAGLVPRWTLGPKTPILLLPTLLAV